MLHGMEERRRNYPCAPLTLPSKDQARMAKRWGGAWEEVRVCLADSWTDGGAAGVTVRALGTWRGHAELPYEIRSARDF